MVSDRFGSLIVQAAASGALDFRQADRFDRNWWRRLRLILEALDRQNEAQLARIELDVNTQLLASLPVASNPSSFDIWLKHQQNLKAQLESAYRPWIKFQSLSPQDTIKAMTERYSQEFLNPASAEFDAELARLEAYWASDKEDPNF